MMYMSHVTRKSSLNTNRKKIGDNCIFPLNVFCKEHDLSKWFFKQHYPKLTYIEDYDGLMKSKMLQELNDSSTYLIVCLKYSLRREFCDDLRLLKQDWKDSLGVFQVNDYKRKSGTFMVFYGNNITDSDGHKYQSLPPT